MLQNEYLDAKIGVDTAENEPSKVCLYFALFRLYLVLTQGTTTQLALQLALQHVGWGTYVKIKSLGRVKIK